MDPADNIKGNELLSSGEENMDQSGNDKQENVQAAYQPWDQVHHLFEQAPTAVIILKGPEFIVELANAKALEIIGRTREESLGSQFGVLLPELEMQNYHGLLQVVYQSGERYVAEEAAVTFKRNNERIDTYVKFVFQPLKDEKNCVTGIMITGDDIGEKVFARKQLQALLEEKVKEGTRELEDNQSFLRQLIDSSVEFVAVLDKQFRFVMVNKKFEETMRLTREAIIGKHLFEINPKAENTEQHQCILRALKGKTVHLDKRQAIALPDYYVDTYFVPLILQNTIEGVIIMSRDVTEIVQTEKLLEQKNTALEQSNKELESFNYMASHDLQEPLRKIQIFAKMLQDKKRDTSQHEKYVANIVDSAGRMSLLIQSILDYSRVSQKPEIFKPTNLDHVLQNVLSDHELIISEKNAVIESDPLPVIKAVPLQMQQLFSNLLNNSLKFSDKEPLITIRSKIVSAAEIPFQPVPAGQYAEIQFSDNGIGFDPEYAGQIFKLFQRLHSYSEYSGTGVGLSIVQKIIEQHRGFIHAESVMHKGATFTIWLPV